MILLANISTKRTNAKHFFIFYHFFDSISSYFN